jgi:hypothetical protein
VAAAAAAAGAIDLVSEKLQLAEFGKPDSAIFLFQTGKAPSQEDAIEVEA